MISEPQISTKPIIYSPDKKSSALYRFHTIVKNGNPKSKRTKDNQFTRKVKVKYLGKIGEMYVHQFLCLENEMTGVFDTLLMKKLSGTFDEMLIGSDSNGKVLKILNIPQLKKRWKDVKIKLKKNHGGDALENYFRQIEEHLENEELLIKFSEEKRMYGLFFNGFWNAKENEDMSIENLADGNYRIQKNSVFKETYNYKSNLLEEANALSNIINHTVLCLGSEKKR